LETDKWGNIYATGYYVDSADFDPGPLTYTLVQALNSNNIFFLKYSSSGNFIYAKAMGGAGSDYGQSISVDTTAKVYGLGVYSPPATFSSGISSYTLSTSGFYRLKFDCNPGAVGPISGNTIYCASSPLNFSIAAIPDASSYSWVATGGATITSGQGTNSVTMLSSSSNATVLVTPSNSCGIGATRSLVLVPVQGVPGFTSAIISPTSVCSGSVVQFSIAPAYAASGYSFSSSASSTLISGTSITYTLLSVYNPFTLNIIPQNICGSGQNASISVQVNPLPNLTITASPGTIVCQSQTLSLNAAGANTYSWSNGIQNGIPFLSSASGIYSVNALNVFSCAAAANVSVTVLPTPTLTISVSPSSSVCPGQTILINPGVSPNYSASSGIVLAQSFVPQGSAVHTILAVGNNGCIDSRTLQLTIHPVPQLSLSAIPSFSVCQNSGLILTASGALSYSWSGGIYNASTFTPVVSGTYSLTGTNQFSCSKDTLVFVKVNPLPVIGYLVSPSQTVCAGTPVILTGVGAVQYSWTGGVTNGQAFNILQSQTYTVSGTDINGCTSNSSLSIVAKPLPLFISPPVSQTLSISSSTFLVSSAMPGTSAFQWQCNVGFGYTNLINGALFSGVNDDTLLINNVSFLQNGNFFRCIATFDNCTSVSDSARLTIFDPLALHQFEKSVVKVYPVPSIDHIFIEIPASQLGMEFTISNELGIELIVGKLQKLKQMVSVKSLDPGIYTISISNCAFTYRIVKE
jgi:hypothetical protein